VSYVDDQIGVLLNTLREARFADNTIVMVLADHGDMLGERGLWYKMNFFEPACTIPLIVHAPGRFKPHRVAESASLLDVLPTLAEIANGGSGLSGGGSGGGGGSAPAYAAPIDGRSLLPALKGQAAPGPPGEVIGEYLAEGAIAPIVMIRRGRYKFVHSPVDPDQLYDLATDPDERANLAGKPEHAQTTEKFRTETASRWNLPALHEAVIANQRQRHFVYPALRQGRFQSWDFQPIRDASRLYIRNDQELNDLEAMARFPRPE
jgi:choline-sulfatase